MKSKIGLKLAVAAAWMGIATMGIGAESKVAVVSMERLIRSHPETRARVAALEAQIKEFETEYDGMLVERDKLKKEFDLSRDEIRDKALSETAKEEKVAQAEEKLTALRKFEGEIGQSANQRRKQVAEQKLRIQQQVLTDLQRVLATYAEKKKIDLILDSSNRGLGAIPFVMFHGEKMDITADIIKLIDGVETDEDK